MKFHSIFCLFLLGLQSHAVANSQWNHNNSEYKKGGMVQLKDASGNTWTQDSSNDYRSLNSTSSPTVLNNIVTSQPAQLLCFEDVSSRGKVYYKDFGIFEIPTACVKKFSVNTTNYYSRAYQGQSPYFTYNYPSQAPFEHSVDAGFNEVVAKLQFGFETPSPFMSDVFFRITSLDGEVLHEEIESVPNDGNTTVNFVAQVMRYNQPESIDGAQFATWDVYVNASVDGENKIYSRFYFLILKTSSQTAGHTTTGDVSKYYTLNN